MKRKDYPTLAIRGLILVMFCALGRQGAAFSPLTTLKALSVSAPGSANELQLRVEGDYSYKAFQATPDTLSIDLTGVQAYRVAKNGEWSGGLLTSYRLLQFKDSTGQPVVRVQVEMKHHQAFQVRRTNDSLVFVFGDNTAAARESAVGQPSPLPGAEAKASNPVEPKAQPSKTSGGMAEVSGVSISAGSSGEVFVDVAMTVPTPFHVNQLSNPRRLVVDLDGARQSLGKKTFSAQSPLLSDVRIGQFRVKNPSVVRVVADLTGESTFDVHSRPGGIRIELKSHTAAGPSAKPAIFASTPQTPKLNNEPPPQVIAETQAPQPLDEATTPGTVTIKNEPVVPRNSEIKTKSDSINYSEYHNALPASSGSVKGAAAPRSEPPEQTPESIKAGNAAKVLANSTETIAQASQSQNPASGMIVPDQAHFTGEPISLNFKDLDLKDFFRLIHEISGLNILVDPDVNGTVTMVLDNVPWDQALDIVLKNNGLGKTLEGNVLRISKVQTLTAEQETTTKLLSARDEGQPLVTRFVPVNYAKATDLQKLLKSWLGGGALSKRGNVLVDDRTNTLIVSDIGTQIPVILQIIQRLDTKSKQISIEARVIVATKNFSREIQGALNNGIRNPSGSVLTGGATGVGASAQGNIPPLLPDPKGPVNTIGQTNVAGFGSYVINNMGAKYFISAMVSAAESKGQVKTISKPVIVTQNNVKGMIVQGVQVPVQTTIVTTVTTTYIPAALTLEVTPQVTADGNIFLTIRVDNGSVGSQVFGVAPTINTQSATTQVLVPDGGTVIFGGVTVNGESKSATYIPLLGQIPVIGHLFKSSTHSTNDSELLFFISPKILPG